MLAPVRTWLRSVQRMMALSFQNRCSRALCLVAWWAVGVGGSMAERAVLKDKHVIVVGAGVGGLVSALLLAHSGVRVTLVESASAPGGKMRQINVGGALVDSGPTVFTMRWVFEHIFAQVGCKLSDMVKLEPLGIFGGQAWGGTAKGLD